MGRGTGPSTVKLYYRIGEVAGIVGVEPHVLRYWETEFPSIRPQKSRSGQRVYSRRDVDKLLRVKELLYAQRFTIAGARQRLRDGAFEGVVASSAAETPTDVERSSIAEAPAATAEAPAATAEAPAATAEAPAATAEAPAATAEAQLSAVEHMPSPDARGQAAQSLRAALCAVRSDVHRMLDAVNHRRCGNRMLADGNSSTDVGADHVESDHVGHRNDRQGSDRQGSVEPASSFATEDVVAVPVGETSRVAERSLIGT